MWNSKCSKIFSELIAAFDSGSIRYLILRNYEGLPMINLAKDVDIIIEPGSYQQAAEIIHQVFVDNLVVNIYVARFERLRCWHGINIEQDIAIHIDFIEGYLSKGVELVTFDELYQNTTFYHNLVVLNREYDTVMLLLYKLIMAKELKPRYRAEIAVGYASNPQRVREIIASKVGCKLANKVSGHVEREEYDKIERMSAQIARVAKRRAFWKKPLTSSLRILKFLGDKFYRIVICPAKYRNFIAVLGADGTGKSTFIEGLVAHISWCYVSDHTKCHIYHHRPTVLPNLGSVGERAGVMVADRDFNTPHRGEPVGFISSMCRMVYYWLDYLLGGAYLLRRDVQYDRYTIYDRYIYDFLIDPQRSRISLPYWLRKVFSRLVPQPRIVFILVASPEVIYNRKQELTKEEIQRQLGELGRLAKSNDRFVTLDASKRPEELVREAMGVILAKFTHSV